MAKILRHSPRQQQQSEFRINRQISASQVRLVGENVEVGIYSLGEALAIADKLEMDLVEISPNAAPPVCRVVEFQKFLYEKKKKEKEMKAKAAKSVVKEVRFTSHTDDHDLEFKTKHAEKFLQEGYKVKAYVQYKGRAIMFKDQGSNLLQRFIDKLSEVGTPEHPPKLEGKRLFVFIVPKGNKK